MCRATTSARSSGMPPVQASRFAFHVSSKHAWTAVPSVMLARKRSSAAAAWLLAACAYYIRRGHENGRQKKVKSAGDQWS